VAISSFIIYFFVANVWRNPTSQFLFSLAKVAKAAAIVANDGGVKNVANLGKSRKTGGVNPSQIGRDSWETEEGLSAHPAEIPVNLARDRGVYSVVLSSSIAARDYAGVLEGIEKSTGQAY
jgi:hypothetical protein